VTIAFQGEVEHEDTAGNRGRIRPGDVQWMTAGSGVLHKEMHSADFTQHGGRFEMLQLWVNLPSHLKMVEPRYQELLEKDIPIVELPGNGGYVRVIAGQFAGTKGPAKTFTPIDLLEVRLPAGESVQLDLCDGHTGALVVMKGEITLNDLEAAHETELVVLQREGQGVTLKARQDATIFVMSGEPIDEPIVGHGPFVMNSPKEIAKAIEDFYAGKFGSIPAQT
jgi:redox-sensitive bicupin YhaK (pirin superfamily)